MRPHPQQRQQSGTEEDCIPDMKKGMEKGQESAIGKPNEGKGQTEKQTGSAGPYEVFNIGLGGTRTPPDQEPAAKRNEPQFREESLEQARKKTRLAEAGNSQPQPSPPIAQEARETGQKVDAAKDKNLETLVDKGLPSKKNDNGAQPEISLKQIAAPRNKNSQKAPQEGKGNQIRNWEVIEGVPTYRTDAVNRERRDQQLTPTDMVAATTERDQPQAPKQAREAEEEILGTQSSWDPTLQPKGKKRRALTFGNPEREMGGACCTSRPPKHDTPRDSTDGNVHEYNSQMETYMSTLAQMEPAEMDHGYVHGYNFRKPRAAQIYRCGFGSCGEIINPYGLERSVQRLFAQKRKFLSRPLSAKGQWRKGNGRKDSSLFCQNNRWKE